MTCYRPLIATLTVALASCATNPAIPAQSAARPHLSTYPGPIAATPEFKKPVRMNGRGTLTSISLSEFFALQQSGKVLIYDARLAFFYHLGHIPGAINLTKARCDDQVVAHEAEIKSALAHGRTVVVYCSGMTCPDARTVAIHISGFGYPVTVFGGGWDAWKEAGMPSE